jgi:toxin ParE1/3/4
MSLEVFLSERAEQDAVLQYRWYFNQVDLELAERYLSALNHTIEKIASHPSLGVKRSFAAPELSGVRSLPLERPFDRHLIFYRRKEGVSIERIMHGSRDLTRRLLEEPEI